MNKNSDMTPINIVFMLVASTPYIGMKFGYLPILVVAPLLLHFSNKSYHFYLKRAKEKKISYVEALEEDLPDMSPLHFLFFFLIAAPILLIITGGQIKALIGVGILYGIYFVYYYWFKPR